MFKDRLLLITIALIFSIMANTLTIYSIIHIPTLKMADGDSLKTFSTLFSLLIQLLALGLGAIYFLKNKKHDVVKITNQKRNELLNYLVKDLKSVRDKLNIFFDKKFANDQELKTFKTAIVEEFSTISAFVESSETIFCFEDKSIRALIAPSSIIQTSHLFQLSSLSELNNYDMDFLKSEFSTSIMSACKACWSQIK